LKLSDSVLVFNGGVVQVNISFIAVMCLCTDSCRQCPCVLIKTLTQDNIFRISKGRFYKLGKTAKVKLSLCFNRAPRHEGILGEWRYITTHSLTSTLDGGEWSALLPGRFTPRESAPGTHGIGGWD
jgi:hypothetical protein